MEWSDQFGQVSDDGWGHHEIADESQVVRVENAARIESSMHHAHDAVDPHHREQVLRSTGHSSTIQN